MTATKELNYQELQELLSNYYGTENYFKPMLCNSMVYTDGVKAFAENAGGQGAYWFIDKVVSNMKLIEYYNSKTNDNFFLIKLEVSKDNSFSFKVTQEDEQGENQNLITQNHEYTDLQKDDTKDVTEYKFYLIKSYFSETEYKYVLHLPSEY